MNAFTKATSFLKEVFGEIKKIVWPTRAELIGASIVVCILALFFAVILGGMDSGFSTIIKRIIAG